MKNLSSNIASIALSGGMGLVFCVASSISFAQEIESTGDIEEIIVEGSLGSLPGEDIEIFGFGKSLLETPRSASTISFEQLERFNVSDIDELIAFAPGTFTQSFFGVAGSLDVRGTPGETYFRGVRRLDNPGNYPTPIGASDRVDIVRGPASPIFGPAKIGGYLNFNPKSARAESGEYITEPTGAFSYTGGSFDKNVITAEFGGPISDRFGYYLYAEIERSDSFYENSETDQDIFQASFDVDINDKLRLQFGGQWHRYEGNQIAGWNRLTQELIDNGTYITGDAQPLDGIFADLFPDDPSFALDGVITHQEFDQTAFAFAEFEEVGISQFSFLPGIFSEISNEDINPLAALVNPGTTTLDESQVLVAEDDTLENEALTLYFDLVYLTDSGWEFKNQLFFDTYNNLNENAYGFSQFHDSFVIEDKVVFSKEFVSPGLVTSLQLSPSIRYTDFEHGDDFANEFFDRRDITGPASSLNTRLLATQINDDFTTFHFGTYLDLGAAALVDLSWEFGLSGTFGLRYDTIDFDTNAPLDLILESQLIFLPEEDQASTTEEGISWTASVSYDTPIGLIPYITVSEQSTVIAGQGAEVTVENVQTGNVFDSSELFEVGLKGSFVDDSLYFAVAYYEQTRVDFAAQAIVTNSADETTGIEAEVRWVANENLVLTAAYTNIEVVNLDASNNEALANSRFSFLGAEDLVPLGVDPTLVFGGQVIGVVNSPDSTRAGIPEEVITLTGTYAFNNGFSVSASVISAEETPSGFTQQVILPSYTLLNLGVAYETENWAFNLTGKNLTDERYFRSNFPNLFGTQIVLPELPINFQASIAYRF